MIGDDVNETMNMSMGPERARAMLRQAVQLARLAYEECVQLGLDADVEYAQAVDEAEAQAEKEQEPVRCPRCREPIGFSQVYPLTYICERCGHTWLRGGA